MSEKCPIDHEVMRHVYAEHGPAQAELRALVEPLGDALAAQIEVDTNEWDPVGNWVSPSNDAISHNLSYGDDLIVDPYMLPPHVFGRTMEEVDFTIPDSYAGRKTFVEEFIKNRPPMAEDTRFITNSDTYLIQNLPYILGVVAESKTAIDPDKWERHLTAANGQLERFFHLEAASGFRNGNIQNMLSAKPGLVDIPQVGRFDAYMYRSTGTLFTKDGAYMPAPTGYLFMPVGEYGPEFTEKLLNTTLYTVERAGITCGELADQLAEGHEEVITTHMARGREEDENRNPGGALLASLQEGALSITQSLALLTAQKVEGYDDPVKLSRAIADAGLVEQFTRAVPMGLVGPFVFSGRYLRDIVVNTDSGLRLNPETMEVVKQWRYKQIGQFATMWKKYHEDKDQGNETSAPAALGIPCPAAFAHGAVANMSRAMVTALEGIGRFPDQKAVVGRHISQNARPVAALITT